jgi:hypothetical protein
MKHVPCATVLSLILLCAPPVFAQCTPGFALSTPTPTTGQGGVMFDLEPTGGTALQIESFDVYFTGTTTIEVWARTALESFVGFQSTMAGWTLLGSATVTGLGTATAVPLNLCLGHPLLPGGRTGFYIATNPAVNLWYLSVAGSTVGAAWQSDPRLTVYHGHSGTYFNNTIVPRAFCGVIHYSLGENILEMSQSGPGVGDLTTTLNMISAGALQGWTLVTTDVAQPVSTGPLLGIWPENVTWSVLGFPIQDGNPFHFPVPSQFGLFPNTPFTVGPGTLTPLAGQTMDFVTMLFGATGFVGRSNVVRITFQ